MFISFICLFYYLPGIFLAAGKEVKKGLLKIKLNLWEVLNMFVYRLVVLDLLFLKQALNQ